MFSGSVQGDVHNISIASSTASIDCSQGNFFTLTNNSATPIHLTATNITGGRTITLRVDKTNASATFDIDTGSVKFPDGFPYNITTGNNVEDILTFVTFDTSAIYSVATNNFV